MSASNQIPTMDIDMTPMIDVVFQLLIFFMLVNQMVQLERAQLDLPVADQAITDAAALGDSRQLVINIHKNGDLEVSTKKVGWEELVVILDKESNISRDAENNSSRVVSIRADYEAPYKTIQKALLECAKKRIYRISFEAKTK